MKIIIIISLNPYFTSSASANRWLTLIQGLSELGAKVTLLIYGGYQSEKEAAIWKLEGDHKSFSYKYINPQITQGYFKIRYYTYFGAALKESRLHNLILKELKINDGIVWTDSSLFAFKLAVQMKKKKYNHSLFLELSEYLDILKNNKSNIFQRLMANKRQHFFEKKAFYAYDGLALMTKTLLRHYKMFPEPSPKLLHLPMTVDLTRFGKEIESPSDFEKPYIAYIGVMNNTKDGVNILIKAFAKIHVKFPDYKLYLVGGWHYDTEGHKLLIKEKNLQNFIFLTGEISRDIIPAIIKNASLLVLPRPDSKQAQGGFPTKLGEYLATGNPVCATKVGEIQDYLVDRKSVYFAKPGSVDSFAQAMTIALNNPEEARKIGFNGKIVAEKYFNKDIQAKILYDFLNEKILKEVNP